MSSVSIIIPTLNECEGIEDVLRRIPHNTLQSMGYGVEVLVVDGGSTDGTLDKVQEADLCRQHGGKAEAVRRGVKETKGEFVFLIDGDGSYPPEAIPDMVKFLERGNSMVLASRFKGKIEKGSMSLLNKIGNRMLTWLANRLYPENITDLCTGLRGMNRYDLECIPGTGFQVEAGIHTVMAGKGIAEVGIIYKPRKGTSKLSTIDGFKIAGFLLSKKIRRR
ncbi:MAG: glycosyltransferase family 2 protein [Thermoplasmata archaeon]